MPSGLEKIIALMQRTGDRCIVLDHAGNPAYVVVPFDAYERLVAGHAAGLTSVTATPEELRRDNPAATPMPPAAGFQPLAVESGESASGDQYYFEPIE